MNQLERLKLELVRAKAERDAYRTLLVQMMARSQESPTQIATLRSLLHCSQVGDRNSGIINYQIPTGQ